MKITRRQLRRLIKEELSQLNEADAPEFTQDLQKIEGIAQRRSYQGGDIEGLVDDLATVAASLASVIRHLESNS